MPIYLTSKTGLFLGVGKRSFSDREDQVSVSGIMAPERSSSGCFGSIGEALGHRPFCVKNQDFSGHRGFGNNGTVMESFP